MLRRTVKTFRTKKIIEGIKGLHIQKGTSETQSNSNSHEKSIIQILEKNGIQKYNPKGNQSQNSIYFRNVFSKMIDCPFGKIDFQDSYIIKNNLELEKLGLEKNKTYSIHQPNGSQKFPDITLFRIEDFRIRLLYIECKGKKPTFNNTPPKKNTNCIYICGNEIFNGYYLRSYKCIQKYNEFQRRYKELIQEINNDSDYDMVHVQYKKTEFSYKEKSWPPKYFNNKNKYSDTLTYFNFYNIM